MEGIAPQPSKQVPCYDDKSGYHFWLYSPKLHKNDKKWPLLVFLHGAGESGTDLAEMVSIGATGCPPVEISNGTANPTLTENFIIASPQTNYGWSGASKIKLFVQNLIESVDLAVDESRVYCTGVSMGGGGCWVAGSTGLFAAIAPVCGTQRVNPSTLEGVDIWAFHGANDIVVPVGETDSNVENINNHRANKKEDPIKYTRYNKAPAPVGWEHYDGHASWIPAYKDDDLWRWFLTKSKEL